jgi:hypothetical protein
MKLYRNMSKIEEIRAEIRLIRIRRQEIAAEPHPSHYLKEYIALMRREVEALEEINQSLHNRNGEVFRP